MGKDVMGTEMQLDRVRAEFSLPVDRVWLNASHQGPLPNRGAAAATQMIEWKQQPHNLATPEPFEAVPRRLRTELAGLLSVPDDQIVLANSSSYGLHLVANGLPLTHGDEVIVAANDFPSDILPWIRLEPNGVVVKQVRPQGEILTVDEVRADMTANTRVVCLPWVHSFSGHVADLDAIGEACRSAGVFLVINGSQGVGAIPISPRDHPIDALTSVGFKWMCGPYGTGMCWLGERLSSTLRANKLYWLSALTADDLAAPELALDTFQAPNTAAQHDVFGTANFFNFSALAESVSLVAQTGVGQIHDHNLGLAARLTAGIDPTRYEILDRGDSARRSSIVFARPLEQSSDEAGASLADQGIDVARRRGMLRFAVHFYNNADDIDRALAALNKTR